MPYHVFAFAGRGAIHGVNLDDETLQRRFVEPYQQGVGITWDGRTLMSTLLDGIRIYQTDGRVGGTGRAGFQAARNAGTDVTNDFITCPPGEGSTLVGLPSDSERERDARRVMVVHGRNVAAVDGVASFLRALGLEPILWEDAVEETGLGSPHNLAAVIAAMKVAQAVVVIFTAEDEARLLARFRTAGDTDELVGQPRPNVLLEAGLAMGLGRERTILVGLGDFRGPSDFDGLNAVRLDNSAPRRAALRRRLATAGCAVNDRDHFLNVGQAGDFDAALGS